MEVRDLAVLIQDRMDRMEVKLDKVAEAVAAGDAKHQALEKEVLAIEVKVEPIREHVAQVKGIGWFLGGIATIVGVIVAVKQLFV